MSTIHVRAHDRDGLARFLGWFSIGLGTMQLAAPRALCKLVGASGDGSSKSAMRLMGLRELGHGTAILTSARPTAGVASRSPTCWRRSTSRRGAGRSTRASRS